VIFFGLHRLPVQALTYEAGREAQNMKLNVQFNDTASIDDSV
jgi:hypothetical protein